MRPVFMQLFTMTLGIMAKRNIIIKEFLPPQSDLSAATASLNLSSMKFTPETKSNLQQQSLSQQEQTSYNL